MTPTPPKGKNGYLAVKPTPDSAAMLAHMLTKGGLADAIEADDLHTTLYYAPQGLPDTIHDGLKPDQVHLAFVNPKPRVLGEGKWQAIVLELDSQTLHQRHDEIRSTTGVDHSYPDYTPHLSVKYQPAQGDLEKVQALFEGLSGMAVLLTGEYCEDLD